MAARMAVVPSRRPSVAPSRHLTGAVSSASARMPSDRAATRTARVMALARTASGK